MRVIFRRLSSEGYVTIRDNHGARVILEQEVDDADELMLSSATAALRLGASSIIWQVHESPVGSARFEFEGTVLRG